MKSSDSASSQSARATVKTYKCSRCGHQKDMETNHSLEVYSSGSYNTCPKCPPFRKLPCFGGMTIWELVK